MKGCCALPAMWLSAIPCMGRVLKAFDPNYKLLDEMYQDDYYAQGTYNGEEFLDAEQITKNKLYIYTREKNTGFDRRFLMKRVGEGWRIDAVQERLDGWQRTGL